MLSFCNVFFFVFLSFCDFDFLNFLSNSFVFLSRHHADQMSEGSQVSKLTVSVKKNWASLIPIFSFHPRW